MDSETKTLIRKLGNKHETYTSFRIDVRKQLEDTILNPDFWPNILCLENHSHFESFLDKNRDTNISATKILINEGWKGKFFFN